MRDKVALLLLWILAAIPLRDGLVQGQIVGAGPDVVSTLWGMWWLQQEGIGAFLGAESVLANYPNGVYGSVLSPSTAVLWSVLEPFVGVGRAMALVIWLHQGLLLSACVWLAGIVGVEKPWSYAAGLVVLSSRYLYFGIGEASIVAVISISIPVGLGAVWLSLKEKYSLKYYVLLAVMIVWTAVENPYLAPVLPLVAVFAAIFKKDKRGGMLATVAIGAFGVLSVAQSFGQSASPDYPREVAGQVAVLFGREWTVVDLPWARLRLEELVWPGELKWTTGAENATLATGGRYMGLISLLLAGISCRQRIGAVFAGLILGCCLLSMGSIQYGFAFPFLLLNALMDSIARPLTQPTRFLSVALVALSVCSSIGLGWLALRHRILAQVAVVAMLFEAILLGGLGLDLPTTVLPTLTCNIPGEKGVLVWPFDAQDGELGGSQLYQIRHGRPSPQTGIASWKLQGSRSFEKVRGGGFSLASSGLNERRLLDAGFDAVLVDGEGSFPGDSSRLVDCGDADLFVLQRQEGRGR